MKSEMTKEQNKCSICSSQIKSINMFNNNEVCFECYKEAINEARLEYGRIHDAERFL